MQVLEAALMEGKHPNQAFLPHMTRVQGFNSTNPIVALSAGYVFWLALTAGGLVYACDTGFDGYAGLLPASQHHGGWHKVNEVRCSLLACQVACTRVHRTCGLSSHKPLTLCAGAISYIAP